MSLIEKYEKMEWKNGKGITDQIYIYPLNSTISDFEWRISSASFDSSGPFSKFEGYQRMLMMLEGETIKLNHLDSEKILFLYEPYYFSGNIETTSEVSGFVKDLNVIWKENDYNTFIKVYKVEKKIEISLQGDENFLFCCKNSFKYENQHVEQYQTLKLEKSNVTIHSKDSFVVQISIKKK